VNSVLAKREVVSLGYDEAIMLDAAGAVAEGTGENIFMVHRDRLYTPPLSMPILDGITRDAVITLARENGIEVVNRPSRATCLYAASEVFFTGTACEVTPVREIDKISIGAGRARPHPRASCRRLSRLWSRVFRDSSGVAGVSVMGFASPSARQG